MMNLVDDIADVVERYRRHTRQHWLLRAGVLGAGLVTMLPLWLRQPSPVLGVLALLLLLLTAIFPRGHVATVFCLWAGIGALFASSMTPGEYGVVALGCLGVHWAAGASTVGPAFAPVEPEVWRGLATPVIWAGAGVLVTLGLVIGASLFTLPSSLMLVALTVGILVVVAAVVLWPSSFLSGGRRGAEPRIRRDIRPGSRAESEL